MDGASTTQPILPPGFRFHPTDEELVVHYLNRKASCTPLPVPIIADIDLYKFDPWELPGKASFGEQEWYFFSPRERKYPNGVRPNRAAASGYWKATGTDKPIFAKTRTTSFTTTTSPPPAAAAAPPAHIKVGVKKALVFYRGRPPKGLKTNWIMHEYRLLPSDSPSSTTRPSCISFSSRKSRRLDDWVLCRIYKKSNTSQMTTSCKLEGKEVSEGWSSYRGGEANQHQVEVEQAKHVAGLPKRGSFTSVLAEADTFLDSIPMPGPNTIDTSSNNTAMFSSNVDNSLSFYNYFARGGGGGGGGEPFLSSPCVTTPFSSPPSHSSICSFPYSNKPESDSTHPFNAPPPLDFPPYDVDFFVKQNNLFSLPSLTQKSPSCVLQQPPKLQVMTNDPLSGYKWPYLARTN